ncbi:MAG: phenylacetate--CoA ligase family protein [bacterium]
MIRNSLSKILFHMYDKSAGLSISRKLRALESSQYLKRDTIRAVQEGRLKRHLAYAYKNSPYWHELFQNLGYSPNLDPFTFLSRLPILTKGKLRHNMSKILVPHYKKKIITTATSGSTGEPIRLYLDTETYSIIKAHLFRHWEWAGYHVGSPWIWVKTDKHDTLNLKLRDWAFHCTYFSVFKLDERIIKQELRKIQGSYFSIIRGYSSGIYVIAKAMIEDKIQDIQVKSAVTTGDNLFPQYRKTIESAFHCKVYDTYGGDIFSIAGQCECDNYHLNEENTYVEIVDDNDKPMVGDSLGHVIVTEFNNRVMPLFRYRIGDMAKLKSGYCPCGRTLSLLGSVEGRDSDLILLPNGRKIVVHFFTIIFENMKGVDQFQVIQEEPLRIIIRLKINKFFDKTNDEAYLLTCLRESAGEEARIEFHYCDQIPLSSSGKRRFVISRVVERQRNEII